MAAPVTDHARNEWASDALTAADDEAAWRAGYEAQRDVDLGLDVRAVSEREQIESWAADRAAVMAEYDPRDFRWWNRWDDE
jgi:hypothetical protein